MESNTRSNIDRNIDLQSIRLTTAKMLRKTRKDYRVQCEEGYRDAMKLMTLSLPRTTKTQPDITIIKDNRLIIPTFS